MTIFLLCSIGLVAGIISGMLGVGGGFILVPMLLYVLKQDMHVAIGTSLVIIVPTALMGAFWHARSGNVNFRYGFIVIAAAVIGGLIGAMLANHLSAQVLRKIFAVLLVVVAIKMFIK